MGLYCRHIEFRFKSIPEADEMIETLKNVKEGVVVKRLVGGMNAGRCLFKFYFQFVAEVTININFQLSWQGLSSMLSLVFQSISKGTEDIWAHAYYSLLVANYEIEIRLRAEGYV